MLNFRTLLAYAPLGVLITAMFSWKLALLLVVLSFLFIQTLYHRYTSRFDEKTYGWALLWINGAGMLVGGLVGIWLAICEAFTSSKTRTIAN